MKARKAAGHGGRRPGAGRPKGSGIQRVTITIRLPAGVHQDMMDTIDHANGESMNEYATTAIDAEAVRRKEPPS